MCENFPNIRVTEGNAFALLLPLRTRTYVSSQPIDEDIDYTQLRNIVFTFGGVEYATEATEQGVKIILPDTLAVGTYNAILTAEYLGNDIRAAYESAVTIVPWSEQSSAEQYIVGSPIVMRAAYVLSGAMTDSELEALKEEYREKKAQLQQAIDDAEEAKREWEQKAADLDGVAKEATSQDILTAVENIDIDTSDLAKQGTNPNATLSEVQRIVSDLEPNQEAVAECYDICEAKGLIMPQHKTLANLPATLATIVKAYQTRAYLLANNANVRIVANSIDYQEMSFEGVFLTNAIGLFWNCIYLRKIDNLHGKVSSIYCMLTNVPNLTWVDMTGIDCSDIVGVESNNTTAGWINSGGALATLVGDRTYEEVVRDNVKVLGGIRGGFRLGIWSSALNHASLRAIINGLGDLTGQTSMTAQFGSYYLGMLTDEEKQMAYDKNWTLA